MPEHDVAKTPDKLSRKTRLPGEATRVPAEKVKKQTSSLLGGTPFQPRTGEHVSLINGAASETDRARLISELQRTYGNRYVQRLMKSINVQAKLTVGAADDTFEQEANAVADQVMSMPVASSSYVSPAKNPTAQRQEVPEEEEIQTKPDIQRIQREEEEERLLLKPDIQRIQREEEEERLLLKPDIQRIQREEEEERLLLKPDIQRIQHEEEEERLLLKPDIQRIQREEEEERLLLKPLIRRDAAPEEDDTAGPSGTIVEDESSTSEPGQMEKSEFLDIYEKRENPARTELSRQPNEEEPRQGAIQMQEPEPEDEIQTAAQAGKAIDPGESFEAASNIEQDIQSQKGNGTSLPDEVRSFMEPRFGADFSGVRVHTGSDSSTLNRELSSEAFTHGTDIFMGEGKYAPGTVDGKRLLAHELTHTLQQAGTAQTKRNSIQRMTVVAGGKRLNLIKGTSTDMDNVVDGMTAYLAIANETAKNPGQISQLETIQQNIRAWLAGFKTNTYKFKGAQKGTLLQLNKVVSAILRNKRPKTGMAREEATAKFSEEAVGIFKDWETLKFAERLQKLKNIANEQLKKAGVLEVDLVVDNKLESGNAEFDYTTWSIKVARDSFVKKKLQKAEMASISDNVYHEARHAEQWFRIARLRAGEGLSAAKLKSELFIPDKVASDAAGKPLKPLSPAGRFFRSKQAAERHDQSLKEAKAWAESVYGTNGAYRGQVLDDIQNRYLEYRALSEEEDAWSAGGKVNENVKNLLSQ